MWPHVATVFAHHPGPHCMLPWGWRHRPSCCYDVNDASRDGQCGDCQRAGGGEWKGSVDDSSEDNNDGHELDSGGGNAAGGKEGTPLKHKGWRGKKQKKRDVEQAYTKITEDGGNRRGGRRRQGKHDTLPHPHVNKL
jgi:hypothetical protein